MSPHLLQDKIKNDFLGGKSIYNWPLNLDFGFISGLIWTVVERGTFGGCDKLEAG